MRLCIVVAKSVAAASMASEHKGYRKPGGGKPLFNLPEITVDLQLTDQSSLCDNRGRQECPKCGKSRSLFCFDCLVPFTNTPHVKLPFNVSVITHHAEALSKTTGVHAALLAPDRVQLHDISRPPDFDPARSIVLYPAAGAITVDKLEADSIDRVFLIDSNWKKSKEIFLNPVLANVRCVKLTEKQTAFWRWHGRGVARDGTSLCTIESLYFLLKALLDAGKLPADDFQSSSCFDDLLWYFTFQHRLIKEYSEERGPQGRKGKRKRGRDDGRRHPLDDRACELQHEAEEQCQCTVEKDGEHSVGPAQQ